MKAICTICVSLAFWVGPVSAQVFNDLQLALEPVHYELDLTVDYDAEQILGNVQLTVRNRSLKTIHEIPLLLYRLMAVNSVRDSRGRALPVTQRVVAFEDFGKRQVNYVTVSLDQQLEPSDTATIELVYEGYLLGYAETGWRYVKDRVDSSFTIIRNDGLAFPLVGVPSLRANRSAGFPTFTYLARITVPASLTVANGGVANGGRLIERSVNDGDATFVYQSVKPSWRMDFAVADYRIIERNPEHHASLRKVVRAPEGGSWPDRNRDSRRLGFTGGCYDDHPDGASVQGPTRVFTSLSRTVAPVECDAHGSTITPLE
jgi:hypothetical protein